MVVKRRVKKKVHVGKVVHFLVPPHTLLSEKEAEAVLKKYGIERAQLAKIYSHDPAIAHLGAKPGDIVRIDRPGEAPYYRVVIE